MPDTPANAGRRNNLQQRQSRLMRATLSNARLGQVIVTIRNLSPQGMGGKSPRALDLAEIVQIDMPGLAPIRGIVRWSFEGLFGIETELPIDLAGLRTALGGALPPMHDNICFGSAPDPFAAHTPPVSLAPPAPCPTPIAAPFGQGYRIS